jgi:hypothetical protein
LPATVRPQSLRCFFAQMKDTISNINQPGLALFWLPQLTDDWPDDQIMLLAGKTAALKGQYGLVPVLVVILSCVSVLSDSRR